MAMKGLGTGWIRCLGVILLMVVGLARANSQDDEFLAAHDAFRAHDVASLAAYQAALRGYLLEPYVRYWLLESELDTASPQDIEHFLTRHAGEPTADALRRDWLEVLGRQNDWSTFLAQYPKVVKPDVSLLCYDLQARMANQDASADAAGKALWFTGDDRPSSCDPVFNSLADRGIISRADVWARIRLSLEAGNIDVAEAVDGYLPPREAIPARALERVAADPGRFLERGPFNFASRAGRELVLFAIYRLARIQPDEADFYWRRLRRRFGPRDRAYEWSQLAFLAALRHDPSALADYARAAGAPLTDAELAWKARAALRVQDWDGVLAAIRAMTAKGRDKAVWRYWRARALEATGHVAEANALFVPLSFQYDYYGQLALNEMGDVADPVPESYRATDREIDAVAGLPGIQRALALYRLGFRWLASREWLAAIRGMDDRQLLAAARLALRYDWYDRAIDTANKTVTLHDFGLRYLMPYRGAVGLYAREFGLDEAWVYGLVRQESRFMVAARSGVGAMGLMQVMPATARWVAQQLGLRGFRSTLSDGLDMNIRLGTYYLKHVIDVEDGDEVLATAAYNAGPRNASKWRAAAPLEGAIYTETIPFSQTRDYVRRVMSNAVYYSQRLGEDLRSLKERMGIVPPRAPDAAPIAGP